MPRPMAGHRLQPSPRAEGRNAQGAARRAARSPEAGAEPRNRRHGGSRARRAGRPPRSRSRGRRAKRPTTHAGRAKARKAESNGEKGGAPAPAAAHPRSQGRRGQPRRSGAEPGGRAARGEAGEAAAATARSPPEGGAAIKGRGARGRRPTRGPPSIPQNSEGAKRPVRALQGANTRSKADSAQTFCICRYLLSRNILCLWFECATICCVLGGSLCLKLSRMRYSRQQPP